MSIKDEYDFSKAERGKFWHQNPVFQFPQYSEEITEDRLDRDVLIKHTRNQITKADQNEGEEIAAGKAKSMDFE